MFDTAPRRSAGPARLPARRATHQSARPKVRQTLSDAPQFSVRLLMIMTTTCALAFAALAAQLHEYLNVAAAMVLIYWMGTTLCFLSLVLDRHGDVWLAPAALAEAIGLGTVVVSLFTGMYYTGIFIVARVVLLVSS